MLRILITAAVVVVLLLLFQNLLIYHPRKYGFDFSARYPFLVPLAYSTAQGRQQAYYFPPRTSPGQPPHRLWVVFPGNGSRALDWMAFLNPPSDSRDGFLLIDYPGYGACQGSPSPAAIEASSEAAFAALAGFLHSQPAVLDAHLNLLCQSIGCATGLNFAVHHPVDRIILLSPFTTLRDMARRAIGWPLCWLLIHNFDNAARLRELAARPHPPRITIFHGGADTLVPITMGRRLAAMFPAMIAFQSIPGAGHNTILYDAQHEVLAAMRD
jgi:alpha-beta hydrolase superfamily lysophospholipase